MEGVFQCSGLEFLLRLESLQLIQVDFKKVQEKGTASLFPGSKPIYSRFSDPPEHTY